MPYAGLTVLNQTLYGATAAGGPRKTGTLFSLTPNARDALTHKASIV